MNPCILYNNRLADATPVASSTAAGYNVLNLLDYRSYTWWKPTALPATVTVDCGSAKAADYAAIYGHNLGSLAATLEVRASTDNFSTSNVLIASITPANDNPFLLQFNSVSYRYWRIRITGSTMPSLAIALIGAALVMNDALEYGFDPVGRDVMGQANQSVQGHPLGKIIDFEAWRQTLQFQVISAAWLRSTFLPAWKNQLRGNPFLLAWDPTNYPSELYLLLAGDKLSSPLIAPGRHSVNFDVSGVALP